MLIKAFGDNALGQKQTYEWISFKKGRNSVDDEESSGWPYTGTTTENMANVWEAIPENRRRTIYNVSSIVGLSYETCQRILPDEINMRCTAAKFVPRLLNSDQKEHRVALCIELKEQAENDPNFISTIVTGDEACVFGHDAENNQQSFQWKAPTLPRPKKTRQIRSNVKSVLILFTLKASCIRNLFQQDRWWMENYIATFWGDWGKTFGANIQTSGATTPGSCITTTLWLTRLSLCSSFWLLQIRQSSPSLPNCQTSPPVIFSYSWRWNWSSRGDVLTALKRSRPYRRTWWRNWRIMTSRSASNHGNPAGITVSLPKGTTLKGMGAN